MKTMMILICLGLFLIFTVIKVDLGAGRPPEGETVDIRIQMSQKNALVVEGSLVPDNKTGAQALASTPTQQLYPVDDSSLSIVEQHEEKILKNRTIYLHIGPLKTGTTSIQASLLPEKIREAATKDGFGLWGPKTMHFKVNSCFRLQRSFQECKPILSNFFANIAKNNVDKVLISHEMIGASLLHVSSTQNRTQLWNMMYMDFLKDYKVKIIVGYRRYYEWKISMANQIFKLHCRCESCCKADFLSVSNIFESNLFEQVAPVNYYTTFPSLFEGSISVVNLHEGYDILERVFCGIVQDAPELCHAIKVYNQEAAKKKKRRRNESVFEDFKRIGFAAYSTGLLQGTTKQKVAMLIEKEAAKVGLNRTHLPTTCLNFTMLEQILDTTLRHEQVALPSFFASNEVALRQGFLNAAHNGKFCTVDTAAVIAEERWKYVLSKVNQAISGFQNGSQSDRINT